MNFTIKIDDSNPKAKSIINLLRELAKDYSFLSIEEDVGLSENIVQELESRYQYVIENPEDGKSWEEVKKNLLSE